MCSVDVPARVPQEVARQARILYEEAISADSPETADIVQCLVSDLRMQAVWRTLDRHSRQRQTYKRVAEFFHFAELPEKFFPKAVSAKGATPPARVAIDPGNAQARQEVAAGLIFHFAVFLRLAGAQAIPVRFLSASPLVGADDPLVVERNRGDSNLRGYVICLAQQCRELFGEVMYRTVATITSVAFGRNITKRTVQKWCDQQDNRAVRYGYHAKGIQKRVRDRS